jgi:hypothetical protein
MVSYSPDGLKLVVAGQEETIMLYDAADLSLIAAHMIFDPEAILGVWSITYYWAWEPNSMGIIMSSGELGRTNWFFASELPVRVALINSTVEGASAIGPAASGAAIAMDAGALTLMDATVRGNRVLGRTAVGLTGAGVSIRNATFTIRRSRFHANEATSGSALSFESTVSAEKTSTLADSRFEANIGESTVFAAVSVAWGCAPGQWSPRIGSFTGDFQGCAFKCAPGYVGTETNHDTPTCSSACPQGHRCSEGTTVPTPCSPGTYSNFNGSLTCFECALGAHSPEEGATACIACPKGKFSESVGASGCTDCPAGGFCASEGAASARATFELCPEGTYNPTEGASSNVSCISCPAGKANPVPGSLGVDVCKDCLPGSYSDVGGAGICLLCDPGKYQDEYGQTDCRECPPGRYCEVGTAKPTPCPAGTASNTTGIAEESQCVDVIKGFWAPIGSALPKACPSSGFICPGRANDDVNDAPGSEPIVIPVGQATEEVASVETELNLDVTCDAFDVDRVKAALAVEYGVLPALITIDDPCMRRKSARSLASLTLTITIATSATTTNEAGEAVTATAPSVEELVAVVAGVSDGSIGLALSTELGVPVSVSTTVPPTAVVETVTKDCPIGKTCPPCDALDGSYRQRGETCVCPDGSLNSVCEVPCEIGTYNPSLNAGRCIPCPAGMTTTATGTSSEDMCACTAGRFMTYVGANYSNTAGLAYSLRVCEECTEAGYDCIDPGNTIESLRMEPGYWRSWALSPRVRHCFNEAFCTPNRSSTDHSTTRLHSNESVFNPSSACTENHIGPYCELCVATYIKASDGGCVKCNGSIILTLIFPIVLLLTMVLLALYACRTGRMQALMDAAYEAGMGGDESMVGDAIAAAQEEAQAQFEEAVKTNVFDYEEAAQNVAGRLGVEATVADGEVTIGGAGESGEEESDVGGDGESNDGGNGQLGGGSSGGGSAPEDSSLASPPPSPPTPTPHNSGSQSSSPLRRAGSSILNGLRKLRANGIQIKASSCRSSR